MVRAYFLGAALLWWSGAAQAVTPDQLREITAEGERDSQARAARVKSGALTGLLPQERAKGAESVPTATPPAIEGNKKGEVSAPPRSEKYSKPARMPAASVKPAQTAGKGHSNETPHATTLSATPAAPSAPQATSWQYIPPPRKLLSANPILTDAVPADQRRLFGIRLGAWLRGQLARGTTNAEPGLVEITVSEDVVGDVKTLPAGTTLFARKVYNDATQRLELLVEKGITPQGLEFKLNGLVFDPQKASGLAGIVSGDTQKIAKRGLNTGLLAAGRAAAREVMGQGVAGKAGTAATDSVLDDSGRVAEEAMRPTITIHVAAQPLLVRIEESF